MKHRHCATFSGAALRALSVTWAAAGGTFKWTGGANNDDWSDGDNYEGGVAPGAGDIVTISNLTATISSDNAASWATASALDRIAPQDTNATIVIYVAEGVTNDFGAGISRTATNFSREGLVEKTGAGAVNFLKATGGQYDFRGHEFHVKAGWANFGKTDKTQYFNIIRIDEGARMTIPTATSWTGKLLGPGDIDCPSDYQLRVNGGTAAEPTVVEAKLGWLHFNSPGHVRILRTDNTAVKFSVYDGVTEFVDIGMRNVPSSAGKNTYLSFVPGGASPTFRYIGTADGAVTDKDIYYDNSGNEAGGRGVFDAGPHGDLTFNGKWDWTTRTWGREHLLICFDLTGSNAVPCTINGAIGLVSNPSNGRTGAVGVRKLGTGCWRLANTNNFFSSAVFVDEGTLDFADIKERGERCSLGTATELKDVSQPGDYDGSPDVPYAIRLGSAARRYPEAGLATLRYSSATNASCTTRPIALAGDARIVSATHKLILRGVTSAAEGVNRLVLDGDAAGVTNVLHDVTDGATAAMRTGVVKDGAGAWILTGTNSFTGPLVVNGGKLVLKRPSDQYTWYRLVIRDSLLFDLPSVGNDGYKLGRIGLFDGEGYRQNIGLACLSTTDDLPQNAGATLDVNIPSFLEPGQFGFGMPKRHYWWISKDGQEGQGLSSLCLAGECHANSCMFFMRTGIKERYLNDTNKYVFIDMRLTNGTPEIAYYDLATVCKYNPDPNVANYTDSYYNLKAWTLMGSTDGITWDELHRVDDATTDDTTQKMRLPPNGGYWMAMNRKTYSSDTAATKYSTAKLQEIPARRAATSIPFFDDTVEYVTVANGGVLEADGAITLSRFRAAAGAAPGVVRGFALAASCTIDVTDIPAGATVIDVPISFEGVAPETAAWTALVDGAPAGTFKAVARNGRLQLLRKGIQILFR